MQIKRTNNSTPIFLAFLCMGFGDVVGPMVSLAKDSFNLSYFMAQLLPASGFITFGVLSIPMGIYQAKKGRKHVLLLGLTTAFVGLIIPILNGMYGAKFELEEESLNKFYVILGSILFLGAGATLLQVSGNPIMRDVSEEGQYSSNLSLAQSIKAIGSSLGFLLPSICAISFNLNWTILFPTYAGILLLTLIWTSVIPISERIDEQNAVVTISSCLKLLLKDGYVALMVLAIFLYVGAEVSMSSQIPILMKEKYALGEFGLIVSWSIFFLPILIGRFAGSAILKKGHPVKILLVTVVISIIGIIMLLTGNTAIAIIGIIMVGLGFANIFPLVFSITIDKLPERSNELSGLMVFAIVGGAFVPMLTGAVADYSSLQLSFVVPLLCIIYIGSVAGINTINKK